MGYSFASKNQLDKVETKSVLSPGLWLVAACFGAAVPISIFGPFWAAIVIWVITTIVVLGTFGIFIFHSVKNPTLLRSEEYSLKSQALAIYGDGSKSPKEIAGILSSPSINTSGFIEGKAKS